MKEELRNELQKATENGKNAVLNVKNILSNISHEMTTKATIDGEDPEKTANELIHETIEILKDLGKTSIELTQAAFSGIVDGM